MTRLQDDDITSRADFEAALAELVSRATGNGIQIEGGWTAAGADGQHWDIVITEVVPKDD